MERTLLPGRKGRIDPRGGEVARMPPSATGRSTLELVGLAARRGEEDLRVLAACARGEPVDPELADALVRAGLLRGGQEPRLPARLLVPVLALEASLGLNGERLLAELHALLRSAPTAAARNSLLVALAAELDGHLDELRDGALATETALEVVADLVETVRRLSDAEADPVLVTRVAALAAQVVERLARALRPRRTRSRPAAGHYEERELARAIAGMVVALPRPRLIPSARMLAAALAGPQPLPYASALVRELPGATACPTAAVRAALADPDPLHALYAGYDIEEALRRHARTVGLGRQVFAEHGRLPGAARLNGPAPLAWTTELVACAAAVSNPVPNPAPNRVSNPVSDPVSEAAEAA